jgi:nucleoside-diphosphate-sugar epimerase
MPEPWMVITGATGFLGSQLVRQLRKEYRIVALGRRDPVAVGAPVGPGIEWFRVDIADFAPLRQVFERIRELGGAHLLLHMAAYYDFTGDDNPEYDRTNVVGTDNLIRLAEPLKLRRFIFASSIAACPFPESDGTVTESTPPDAPVPYARSKRAGEELMRRYRDSVPSCIVRPAAVFSEWCEYEALDAFLRPWCSHRPHARVLAGRGSSAIPYLHVFDLLSFFLRVVEKCDELEPAEVLLASPDGATSHLNLFRTAGRHWFGGSRPPILVSPRLASIGIRLREILGRITGMMPFERSWMVDYIDRQLTVDASRTRRRIDWAPNSELDILTSLDGMLGNLRSSRREWRRRNRRRGPGAARHRVG